MLVGEASHDLFQSPSFTVSFPSSVSLIIELYSDDGVSIEIMESRGQNVQYEIRNHASLPFVPRYPPLPQADGTGSKGGLRSLVSIR
uniref:Uncharacterized protein n=1 Tax=Brassica oleracea var. oleracea TaxID=109376 RepID=A0A0D3DD45_BRAOL